MKISISTLSLLCLILFFSSCQAIGDIFKTGVWVGVIGVVGVIVLIMYFVMRGKS